MFPFLYLTVTLNIVFENNNHLITKLILFPKNNPLVPILIKILMEVFATKPDPPHLANAAETVKG